MKGFRGIRILVLLGILLIVAGTTWLNQQRVKDWNVPLWVYVYPAAADSSDSQVRDYVSGLNSASFAAIEGFFEREAARYGFDLPRPVQIHLVDPPASKPPPVPETNSWLAAARWGLAMRWYGWRAESGADRPDPDVQLFLQYFPPRRGLMLDRSAGLRQGRLGVVNLFASRRQQGPNQVVIVHELLHTIGASDRYDPVSLQPLVPEGLADPDRQPLYPQSRAEIMGGRIAASATRAIMPSSLSQVTIGPVTAAEIGLLDH